MFFFYLFVHTGQVSLFNVYLFASVKYNWWKLGFTRKKVAATHATIAAKTCMPIDARYYSSGKGGMNADMRKGLCLAEDEDPHKGAQHLYLIFLNLFFYKIYFSDSCCFMLLFSSSCCF